MADSLPLCRASEHVHGSWVTSVPPRQPQWDCCGHDDSDYHGVDKHVWLKRMHACRHTTSNVSHEHDEKYRHEIVKFGFKRSPPGYYATMCCPIDPVDAVWTPRSCRLREWSSQHFCNTLGNRTLLLVGDSTVHQFAVRVQPDQTLTNVHTMAATDALAVDRMRRSS